MRKEVEIYIETINDSVQLPFYAREGDAGMDIVSTHDIEIFPGESKIVKTGLKVSIPDGYEIQIRPRSGISLNTPLRVSNSPGTIDSGYKDEIGIILTNTSVCNIKNNEVFGVNDKNKKGTYLIKKGDRIAQMVLSEVPKIKFTKVNNINDYGKNRGGGFGSTGTTL